MHCAHNLIVNQTDLAGTDLCCNHTLVRVHAKLYEWFEPPSGHVITVHSMTQSVLTPLPATWAIQSMVSRVRSFMNGLSQSLTPRGHTLTFHSVTQSVFTCPNTTVGTEITFIIEVSVNGFVINDLIKILHRLFWVSYSKQ